MEKWQQGDMDAFEVLFRQYERLVFKNAYLITGRREEAEDVLQNVFVSVWKSRHTFNPDKGKFSTWLHRITVNECLRKRQKKEPALVPLENLNLPDSGGGEEAAMNKEECERVIAAMNTLDKRHRGVLVLRYLNDLSYDEIARTMGIPLGTVKSRINKGLKNLRERIGNGIPEASI